MPIPSDLSDLLFWRDADNVYTDAGVTPANTSGDLVQQFTDRTGNGWHMTQATSGSRGDVQTVGGLKAVRFNDAHFYNMGNMFGVGGGTPITAAEWFWLLRVPSTNVVNGFNVTSGVGGGPNNSLYPYVNGHLYDANLSTVRHDDIDAGIVANRWQSYSIRSKNGRWSAYVDNRLVYDTLVNTFSATASPIFGRDVLADSYWKGYLREEFGFARELTDAEREAMTLYIVRDLPPGSMRNTFEIAEVYASPTSANVRDTFEIAEVYAQPTTAMVRDTFEILEVYASIPAPARPSCRAQIIG